MSLSFLLPIDGSTPSLRAIDYLLQVAKELKAPPTVHLLNVQPSLHGDISRFVSAEQLAEFHRDEGHKALREAAEKLAGSGLDVHQHVVVGECVPAILEVAKREACNQIIIGSRGHGGLSGVLLGSVSARLTHHSPLPLILVR
jgi:nucleotide-binding universal stress UspA family protein